MKAHSLIHLIYAPDRLKRAARECMRRCSSPGLDGVTWAKYRQGLNPRIERLSCDLRKESWEPGPLRHVKIATFSGEKLEIVIPTVEDRIVHRTIVNAIEPVLERNAFPDFVSGYRPGRSRISALRQAYEYLKCFNWVADVDVARVSDGAKVNEVLDWLGLYIADGTLLELLRRILLKLPNALTPGTGFTPLLINLRLSRIDNQVRCQQVVRFGDNYCSFCETQEQATKSFDALIRALKNCGLNASPKKSRIRYRPNCEDLFLIGG